VGRERREGARARACAVVGANVAEEPAVPRGDAERWNGGLSELAGQRREEREDTDEHERSSEREEECSEDATSRLPHTTTPHR
jgi:hypothetical protein